MNSTTDYERSIKDKLKEKRQETGIEYNILLSKFMIDEFLRKISLSKYSSNFVFKGGFVLSAITGLKQRTTVDIDTMLTGIESTIFNLSDMIEQVINQKDGIRITYSLLKVENIQEEKHIRDYESS